ncbi:hypothetical protein OEZ60_13135 [Defluviimonas sp. WL0024]|uniref:Helix-turn-helix domain-containing protein n=1 Tax=Albidovulum salinarum TaxID=2984153 RepID=A0ABT2X6H1_9RHOB|nr:hypothetical protein [Defluviimonas sp. WL0024]MCU9848949.1 hypothetical protein [Defluviimonas sp. WL0024]
MGRPARTLNACQKAEVETLAAVLSTAQIADYFGIGRTTFFAMMERDAEISERYKRGKARAIGAIAQGLIAKARGGDTASMIFYLKTQAGWRETAAVEHSLAEDGPSAADTAWKKLTAKLDEIAERKRRAGLIEGLAQPIGAAVCAGASVSDGDKHSSGGCA